MIVSEISLVRNHEKSSHAIGYLQIWIGLGFQARSAVPHMSHSTPCLQSFVPKVLLSVNISKIEIPSFITAVFNNRDWLYLLKSFFILVSSCKEISAAIYEPNSKDFQYDSPMRQGDQREVQRPKEVDLLNE